MAAAEESTHSLHQLFTEAHDDYNKIENTTLDTNSEELQKNVSKCQKNLEQLTTLVSQVSLFSSNESIEELPTNSIKFLLLPALLGAISLKRRCKPFTIASAGKEQQETDQNSLPDRLSILRLAKSYFKDFLTRCREYGITTVELPLDGEIEEEQECKPKPEATRGAMPTPLQLQAMGREREEKIKRLKEKKSLQEKLKKLSLNFSEADEETCREFYCSQVTHFVITSLEELESIKMEEQMLQHMAQRQTQPQKPQDKTSKPTGTPLKPFLITRDAAQQKVYGAGYPSLPVMSVDEFYEKRVREGWFPPGTSARGYSGSNGGNSVVVEHGQGGAVGGIASACLAEGDVPDERPDDEQNSDDEDSEVKRGRLQARDEYRDMHRTGWGNTYNRS